MQPLFYFQSIAQTNMAASGSPGMELLYASVKDQIRSQYDALVCCLHWNMVHSGFKCVGTEESVSCCT